MHIVAQVNHRDLGVKVETNCLSGSYLIPRHSKCEYDLFNLR